jgi:hypothetical protein
MIGLDGECRNLSVPIPVSASTWWAVTEAVERVADIPGGCPLAPARFID